MAKEKKHTGSKDQMDQHVHDILSVLNNINSHLASLVYYQQDSRGLGAGVEKALAQPFVKESKTLKGKIEKLVSEELRKFNEENK